MRIIFVLLLAAFVLMVSMPVLASDASAFADWNEGRKEEALAEWRRLAEEGDPLAQYNLASCYLLGDGVRQSREIAIDWLRRSAAGGYVKSMELLGTMLMSQNGFQPQYAEALQLLSKAASAGSPIAKNNLATMYLQGLGVPVDLMRAHRLAAEAGAGNGADSAKLLVAIETLMTPQQLAEVRVAEGGESPNAAIPPPAALPTAAAPPEPPPPHPAATPLVAAATAPPPAPSDKENAGWFLHIASVSTESDAKREWQRQQKLFPQLAQADPVYVEARLTNGTRVIRIFVGGFADRDSALHFCTGFKSSNCLAVRNPEYH
jgi:TPR repeat protein